MPYYWTLEQTHEQEHAIHDALHELLDEPSEVIVHTEPCFSACCSFCSVSDCQFRKESNTRMLAWTTSLLEAEIVEQTGGVKHPDHFKHIHNEEDGP
jgi:hypothetical protein